MSISYRIYAKKQKTHTLWALPAETGKILRELCQGKNTQILEAPAMSEPIDYVVEKTCE